MKGWYYVQRSTDAQVLYIRKAPDKRWEARIDHVNGSHFLFEDIDPGQGRWVQFQVAPLLMEPGRFPRRVSIRR